jgi:hypothetical protein
MMISSGIQVILTLLPEQIVRLQSWYYYWEGLMNCAVEIGSGGVIYIPVSMKIGTGVQATVILGLSSLRVCNVGITDGGMASCAKI